MSENEIPPPKQTSSIPQPRGTSSIPAPKQTSSIPLKKETVRVTLKASDAPPATPNAPVVAAPTKPPMPTGLGAAPPAPSVAAPTAGAPKPPAPAPTIALRPAGAPTAPAPAPTIRINTPGAPGAPGMKTAPLGGAPANTVSLPKATVQLQPPTQPLGTAGPGLGATASFQTSEEEEEGGNDTLVTVLSVLGFLGAAAVVVLQFQIVGLAGKTLGDLF